MQQGDAQERKRKDICERRDASRKWLRDNFWDEFAEVYQGYKVRAEPLIDPLTNQEDQTRTNVAMPTFWTIVRKKAARLSARPPLISVRAKSPQVSDYLSGWASLQWDRAGEQRIQRRHNLQACIFGASVKRHWYDTIGGFRPFRYPSEKALEKFGFVDDNRELRIAKEEDITEKRAQAWRGLDENEKARILAHFGPEVEIYERISRFQGPVSSFVFLGDWYPEPEFEDHHSAAWNTFQEMRDTSWLTVMTKKYYTDEKGQRVRLFDPEVVEEMASSDSYKPQPDKDEEFKEKLRDVLYKSRPDFDVRLIPGKRFLITEEHSYRSGWPWVSFVGNDKYFLGEMPYPWDLQGRYAMSMLVPIPDLLWGIGDSSLRALRFLYKLHNVSVSQRTDLITNLLKPLYRQRPGFTLDPEIVDRGLMRIIKCAEGDLRPMGDAVSVPPEAWTQEAQILRMMQLGEPILTNFGEQTQAAPESQKRAMIARLQNQVQESLSADEIERLGESIGEETTIKILMHQSTVNEAVDVPPHYFDTLRNSGVKLNSASVQRLDQYELQEDFEVFPVIGSTLSLDDEMKKKDAFEIYQLALASPPGIWNVRAAAKMLAATYRGRTADELVLPEPPPRQPIPPIKGSFTIRPEDLEKYPEVRELVYAALKVQLPATHEADKKLAGLRKLAEGSDQAENLLSDGEADDADGEDGQ